MSAQVPLGGARPEVTVVIPTRNRGDQLEAMALPSVLAQQRVEFEVIVVDDGSNDATAERVRALRDERLRVVSFGTSKGPSRARNEGIAAAQAPFVAFLDDDDAWSPQKLRRQLDVAAAESADFVYTSVVTLDERRAPVCLVPAPRPSALYAALLRRNAIIAGPSTVMARTALLRRLGGFDERMVVFEDWDMWLRLARAGKPASCDDVLTAHLVYHRDGETRPTPDAVAGFRLFAEKHALETTWSSRPEVAGAQWRAFAHRRAGSPRRAAAEYWRSGIRHRSPQLLVRAIGMLMGESVMQSGDRYSVRAAAAPEWLDSFR